MTGWSGGWVVGKSNLNENPVVSPDLDLDFDLGFVNVKPEPWTLNDLDWILKNLKVGKARDPKGWCNKTFSQEVGGKSL